MSEPTLTFAEYERIYWATEREVGPRCDCDWITVWNCKLREAIAAKKKEAKAK